MDYGRRQGYFPRLDNGFAEIAMLSGEMKSEGAA
jgi:hypothetical protein